MIRNTAMVNVVVIVGGFLRTSLYLLIARWLPCDNMVNTNAKRILDDVDWKFRLECFDTKKTIERLRALSKQKNKNIRDGAARVLRNTGIQS